MGGALWDLFHGEWSAGKVLPRVMQSFIISCWLFITTSLSYLFRLIKPTSTKSTKKLKSELVSEENQNESSPAFVFKFPVMSPEEIRRMAEEKPATTIQSYRFVGARDCTGFVEGPKVVNLRVEYAFVEDKERPPNEGLMIERDVDEYNTNNRQDKSSEAMVDQCPVQPQEEAIKPDGLQSWSCDDQSLSGTRPLMKTKYLYQKDFFPTFQEFDSDDGSSSFEEDGLSSNGSELDEILSFSLGETEPSLASLVDESDSKRSPVNKVEFDEEIELDKENGPEHDSPNFELEEDMIELMEEEELSESELAELNNMEEESGASDDEISESPWEHQDLVEQLKLELKKVKSIGLPTILEDCESWTELNEPIPWRFEEKFLQEDPMEELEKFYKSYRERMRKFDILNHQKMYAMGFLNLKDELPRMWMRRNSLPHLLQNNLKFYQLKKSKSHPLKQLAIELQNDLESIYVGQTCLSWEFLQWQYGIAKDMAAASPDGKRPFNTFVTELQQFQVLIQRFLENEPFQGPRVLNYVKTRCVRRSLLQVPYLREDVQKDKKEVMLKRLRGEDERVAKTMIVKMIEDTMRIFWEFVNEDKEEVAKGFWVGPKKRLGQSSNMNLVTELRLEQIKKEKKLKELMKASQCFVKIIKKEQHLQSLSHQKQEWLLARVELRLVARVLRMCEPTTDQLMWCQKKLSRINFSDRRVHREQSFLLFPY